MKRLAVFLGVLALVLASCTSPKFEDVTTVETGDSGSSLEARVVDADSITVYRNVDQFANINVMCINGDAIVTRSVNYDDYVIVHVPAGSHNLCP